MSTALPPFLAEIIRAATLRGPCGLTRAEIQVFIDHRNTPSTETPHDSV